MSGRKSVPPSVTQVAFDCPHCGAYTTHTWYDLYAERVSNDARCPGVLSPDFVDRIKDHEELDAETKERFLAFFGKVARGLVVVGDRNPSGKYVYRNVGNVHLSECFHCGDVAVWVHDYVVSPHPREGPPANPDLPQAVLDDYNEAATILSRSPRGAAALLRLAIQKLCAELGGKGKNIDDDIAEMVKNGLSPLIQQALDAVRVIGNESVHPGTLDLKDDVQTASQLFALVNIIAEQMISNPKHVQAMYAKLPEAKREAIDKRDKRE
jgi:hypothetical protein